MGLAPSRNGEIPGRSAVAKVPVPISFTASEPASKVANDVSALFGSSHPRMCGASNHCGAPHSRPTSAAARLLLCVGHGTCLSRFFDALAKGVSHGYFWRQRTQAADRHRSRDLHQYFHADARSGPRRPAGRLAAEEFDRQGRAGSSRAGAAQSRRPEALAAGARSARRAEFLGETQPRLGLVRGGRRLRSLSRSPCAGRIGGGEPAVSGQAAAAAVECERQVLSAGIQSEPSAVV
jgi:hypothetical protein